MIPSSPSSGVYVEIVPATGNVTEVLSTIEATTGSAMSGAATFKMSPAVDTDCGETPLGSAKCVWCMPSDAAVAFIFATKAGMLPASQRASRSA